MLDLAKLDLEEIAMALSDQTEYEHRWMIDPGTGEIAVWTSDTGIDGENPVEVDELDLLVINPLPSWVWYQDMADFAEGVSDETAGRQAGSGNPVVARRGGSSPVTMPSRCWTNIRTHDCPERPSQTSARHTGQLRGPVT